MWVCLVFLVLLLQNYLGPETGCANLSRPTTSKKDIFSVCLKCGKPTHKSIIIAYDFIKSIPIVRGESVSDFKVFCIDCGSKELISEIIHLNCPIWIGLPSCNQSGKKNTAINFKPEIVNV